MKTLEYQIHALNGYDGDEAVAHPRCPMNPFRAGAGDSMMDWKLGLQSNGEPSSKVRSSLRVTTTPNLARKPARAWPSKAGGTRSSRLLGECPSLRSNGDSWVVEGREGRSGEKLNERVLKLLSQVDWRQIALGVTDYAIIRVQRLRWKTASYKDLPQGMTPADLAYEAIKKVIGGERPWDPEQHPDLLRYLKAIVDSLVSHLVESEDHERLQRLPQTQEGTPSGRGARSG